MTKKHFLKATLLIVSFLLIFTSCNVYRVEYPEKYTTAYCTENYELAERHLGVLCFAKNRVPRNDGGKDYYAIKDVPLDKYLFQKGIFVGDNYVVKHKNNHDDPIWDYEYAKVELLWDTEDRKGYIIDIESVAQIDPEEFKEFLFEVAETKAGRRIAYRELEGFSKPYQNSGVNRCVLSLRISFSAYPNLVWESSVYRSMDDGSYYIEIGDRPEFAPEDPGNPDEICIPLYDEIAQLIQTAVDDLDVDTVD